MHLLVSQSWLHLICHFTSLVIGSRNVGLGQGSTLHSILSAEHLGI